MYVTREHTEWDTMSKVSAMVTTHPFVLTQHSTHHFISCLAENHTVHWTLFFLCTRIYLTKDITYKLDQQQLFIKIRIPLTATTTAFTLYRVHSVPIPLGANHSDKTFIEITKPYLAISFDNLFYMMLSESEYQFCTGNHFKRCNQALTMLESSSPDCSSTVL